MQERLMARVLSPRSGRYPRSDPEGARAGTDQEKGRDRG